MNKLLIITGAGTSQTFYMPSVYVIDLLLKDWAKELYPLKEDPSKSLYNWIKEKLKPYKWPH